MSWKDERIVAFDTETTGVDTSARILELGLILYEGRKVVGIKPECLPDFREWCALYGFDGGGL